MHFITQYFIKHKKYKIPAKPRDGFYTSLLIPFNNFVNNYWTVDTQEHPK